ncbi:MAG: hypothetical protein ACHQEM_02835 [Chitinophagales bacterium]
MKIRYLAFPVLLILLLSQCSKSGSGGKPTISMGSVNSVIPVGGAMQATINFTQSNGLLSQGQFTAIRTRLNQIPLPPDNVGADTLVSQIPEFPDKNQGEFQYTLDYNYLHQSDQENDTINFKFAVMDKGGNKSDTISSGIIVVLKP